MQQSERTHQQIWTPPKPSFAPSPKPVKKAAVSSVS
jgi:hypothetical protein